MPVGPEASAASSMSSVSDEAGPVKVIDLLAPCRRGGKIGLFGGAGVARPCSSRSSSAASPRRAARSRCSPTSASAPARVTTCFVGLPARRSGRLGRDPRRAGAPGQGIQRRRRPQRAQDRRGRARQVGRQDAGWRLPEPGHSRRLGAGAHRHDRSRTPARTDAGAHGRRATDAGARPSVAVGQDLQRLVPLGVGRRRPADRLRCTRAT
jgi:hypothetical protein